MNRRQFLTGASAIAVSAALPAAAAPRELMLICAGQSNYNEFCSDPVWARELYWQDRWWWISGEDNVIHFGEKTADWRSFCATGEELG